MRSGASSQHFFLLTAYSKLNVILFPKKAAGDKLSLGATRKEQTFSSTILKQKKEIRAASVQ